MIAILMTQYFCMSIIIVIELRKLDPMLDSNSKSYKFL